MRSAHVGEIPTRPSDLVEAEWKPVRHFFGIEAFGVNAYAARAEGELLIEEHSEAPDGHDELYVVLAGTVRFRLDRKEFEAGAGTLVHAMPLMERGAWAVTPDATVLAIGARTGEPFTVSDWERTRT